jgi:hypothetical protein
MVAEPGTGFDSIRSSVLSEMSEVQENTGTTTLNTNIGTGFDSSVAHFDPQSNSITDNAIWEPEPDYDDDYGYENGHSDDVQDTEQPFAQRNFKYETFIHCMNSHNDSHDKMQV